MRTCVYSGKIYEKDEVVEIIGYGRQYIGKENLDIALERDFICMCANCGSLTRTAHSFNVEGGTICYACHNDLYVVCDSCGMDFLKDDMVYDDEAYEWYCADCNKRKQRKAIKEYSYKPLPKYKTKAHDEFDTDSSITELLFGVELEIDEGCDEEMCAADICEANENVYCKHDGSLNCGVEIVSHPCTLDYHKDEMHWEKICNIARNYDFKSHKAGTCGLHIHVGRNQLGNFDSKEIEDVVAKVVILVDHHWDNMVTFSRRTEDQLEEWAKKPNVQYYRGSEERIVKSALDTRYEGRYQAINLSNRSTIEFRLYRGSLVPETILAALELTSNICKYAMTHSVKEVLRSQWEDLINIEYHEELANYVAKKYYKKFIDSVDVFNGNCDAYGREIRVGDTVVVVNAEGVEGEAICKYLMDKKATVESLDGDRELNVLLNFHEDLKCTHSGPYACAPKHYYWLSEMNVSFVNSASKTEEDFLELDF